MSTMIRSGGPLLSLVRFSVSPLSNSEPSSIERATNTISGCSASFLAASKARAAARERADPSGKTPRPSSDAVAGKGTPSLRSMRFLFIVTARCCCGHFQEHQGSTCKEQMYQRAGPDMYTSDLG